MNNIFRFEYFKANIWCIPKGFLIEKCGIWKLSLKQENTLELTYRNDYTETRVVVTHFFSWAKCVCKPDVSIIILKASGNEDWNHAWKTITLCKTSK